MAALRIAFPAAIGAIVGLAHAPGAALAATKTYSTGTVRVAIPDGGAVQRAIEVRDRGPTSFVRVSLRLDHERVSDLTLTIRNPAGTEVTLVARRGGRGRNLGGRRRGCGGQLAVFEDRLGVPLARSRPPFTTAVNRPERRLGGLDGSEAHGRWVLRVLDGRRGARGTLFCAKLDISRDVVEYRRSRSGTVAAQLAYRESNGVYRRPRLRITRAGLQALDTPLTRLGCGNCPGWRPALDLPGGFVRVLNLDGGSEPEVVVDLYTGGAHCCTYSLLYRYLAETGTYARALHWWGNASYTLRDLDGDGRPEFRSSDDRFAYRFTAYAFSFQPVRIWRYERGRMTDATRRFPGAVAKDAHALWRLYLRARQGGFSEVRGILAAYLADEALRGQERRGWARLEVALRRGDLGRGAIRHGYPAGRQYLDRLRTFLRQTGYLA